MSTTSVGAGAAGFSMIFSTVISRTTSRTTSAGCRGSGALGRRFVGGIGQAQLVGQGQFLGRGPGHGHGLQLAGAQQIDDGSQVDGRRAVQGQRRLPFDRRDRGGRRAFDLAQVDDDGFMLEAALAGLGGPVGGQLGHVGAVQHQAQQAEAARLQFESAGGAMRSCRARCSPLPIPPSARCRPFKRPRV